MISREMSEALNGQIKKELDSSYIYLSMAEYFKAAGYDGMAQWMTAQAKEELGHATRIMGHLNERGGRVELEAIDKPQTEWQSPLAVFEASLEHEKYVTASIHTLVKDARKADDLPSEIFLQWFVNEQVEEEDSVGKIVDTLKKIGDSTQGLIMLDHALGKRE